MYFSVTYPKYTRTRVHARACAHVRAYVRTHSSCTCTCMCTCVCVHAHQASPFMHCGCRLVRTRRWRGLYETSRDSSVVHAMQATQRKVDAVTQTHLERRKNALEHTPGVRRVARCGLLILSVESVPLDTLLPLHRLQKCRGPARTVRRTAFVKGSCGLHGVGHLVAAGERAHYHVHVCHH